MAASRCSRCHRILKDPFSIAIGMGPECRGALGQKGWTFPRPKWKVTGGRTVLVGVVGEIEPPPTGDLPDKKKKKVKHGSRNQSKS